MPPAIDLDTCTHPALWTNSSFTWSTLGLAGIMLTIPAILSLTPGYPGRRWLLGLQVCASGWLALAGMAETAHLGNCLSTLMLLQRLLMMAVPALWLPFVVQYSANNHSALPRWCVSLSIVPWLLFSALELSSDWQGPFWDDHLVKYGRGHTALSELPPLARAWLCLLLAASVCVLAIRSWHATRRDKWLLVGLSVAGLLPWLVAMGHHTWGWSLQGQDPTPLAMTSYFIALASLAWIRRSFDLKRHARNLLFTEIEDPMLIVDRAGIIVELNHACAGMGDPKARPSTPLSQWQPWGAEILKHAGSGVGPFMLTDNARQQHYELQLRPVHKGLQTVGQLVHLHDVTELVRTRTALAEALCRRERELASMQAHEAELIEASLQDPLTGLHNRRGLERRFAEEAAHAHTTGHPLTLAMIDLDHFKRVNDSFGHAAGDDVLKALARLLLQGVRSTDTVYRIGGEEFVILLPGADGQQAAVRVNHLRVAFHAASVQAELRTPVTFSAGIAGWNAQEPALDMLLAKADEALYRAKANGRDRVEFSGDSDSITSSHHPQ